MTSHSSKGISPAVIPPPCYLTGSCTPEEVFNGQSGFVFNGGPGDEASFALGSGDINGDGLTDFILCARSFATNRGRTFVVFGSVDTNWTARFDLNNLATGNGSRGFVFEGENAGDFSGQFAATGDVNGDGIHDLLISACFFSNSSGRTYVVFGSRNHTTWGNGTMLLGTLASGDGSRGFVLDGEPSEVSSYAATTGDLNSDTIADIIISATNSDSGAGRVFVVYGSNISKWLGGTFALSNLTHGNGELGFVVYGEMPNDHSSHMTAVGDMNGDGLNDLIIGAPGAASGKGRTYVVFNTGNWTPGFHLHQLIGNISAGFVIEGEADNDNSAFWVIAGDINGDKKDDLLIGAAHADANTGKLYLVYGSYNLSDWNDGSFALSNLAIGDGSRGIIFIGEAPNGLFSHSFNFGDFNGDGMPEILMDAAYLAKSYVVFGSHNMSQGQGTFPLKDLATANGTRGFVVTNPFANLYGHAATSGDFNGDGYWDFVVGAPESSSYAGQAFVMFGAVPPPSKSPTQLWTSSPTLTPTDTAQTIEGTIISILTSNVFLVLLSFLVCCLCFILLLRLRRNRLQRVHIGPLFDPISPPIYTKPVSTPTSPDPPISLPCAVACSNAQNYDFEHSDSYREHKRSYFSMTQFRGGAYRVEKVLGEGAFSMAYLVRDAKDCNFVIKMQRRVFGWARDLPAKEASMLCRLPRSPHLLRFVDFFFESDELFCLVLEYCSGGTLNSRISLFLPPREVWRILRELCTGLAVLHKEHIVHRDVKPDNIFLRSSTEKPTIVLGDMGLARVTVDGYYDSTFGHNLYKAPEVGVQKFSSRSDMWAVGCVGFELLSGTTLAIRAQHSAVPLSQLSQNDLDEELKKAIGHPLGAHKAYSVVASLLRIDPNRRLTAFEVAEGIVAHR